MVALVEPDEEEKYLLAILDSADGIDLAEFTFYDSRNDDGCYRLYDYQWPWFSSKEMYQIDQGGRNLGKALALDTPIPTPFGWLTMGDIHVGEQVFDENGAPCTVTDVFEIRHDRPCYRVTFSDGSVIVADAEHNWFTWDKAARKSAARGGSIQPQVRTTEQIRNTLMVGREHNHSIPVAQPLRTPARELPLHPWVLGYWLGNGTSTQPYVTCGETDLAYIEEAFAARNYTTKRLTTTNRAPGVRFDPPGGHGLKALWAAGLSPFKRIPRDYFRASLGQRLDLLAGIVDSDGHIAADGHAEITMTNEQLARDVVALLQTLGEQPRVCEGRARIADRDKGPKWRISWTPIHQPAQMPRKAARFRGKRTTRITHRRIVAVEAVSSVPVRCISVDSPNHLYLAGHAMVPTHNTERIKLRSAAHPFKHPGKGRLLTAPELNHLRPLTDEIEKILLGTRIVREMMPTGKGAGIARQPHWQARFKNGATIISRLPNKDGKGVKGCIAGGVLVTTTRGQVPIEDVVVDDWVLTHKGRWRPVTATYRYAAPPAVKINGGGHKGLIVSDSHALMGRERLSMKDKTLAEPQWFDPATVVDEAHQWWLGSPMTYPVEVTPELFQSEALVYLAGAYAADGNLINGRDGRARGLQLVDDQEDMERLEGALAAVGLRATPEIRAGRACRLSVHCPELAQVLEEHFGRRAEGKRIPHWLLGAPRHLRQAFFDAYLLGDGHHSPRGFWEASSSSKEFIIGLRLLGQTLGYTTAYSWVDPKVYEIKGQGLKTIPARRSHRLKLQSSTRSVVVEDDIAWKAIRSITPVEVDWVYDLSVTDDHSFLADGIISHNQHVVELEIDEAQDYPAAGWREVVETLNAGDPEAKWCCHGVSRGVRDSFFEKTQPNSGWKVHRPMAMNRPSWTREERNNKIVEYGGSRQAVDYCRNIYGEHGDASASVFVLAKLMAVVDLDEGSTYNSDVYTCIKLELERFPDGATTDDDTRSALIAGWIDIPGEHFHGYSQRVGNTQVGAPNGYSAFWGGMDVGVTNHPSEILIFGQRTGSEFLELLTRVQMQRINTDDQMFVVERLFALYGDRLRFGIDKTGVGFPLWDQLTRRSFGSRIYGFGFSEKRVAGFEDRELQPGETQKDLARLRNVVEAATDWLRNDHVDTRRFRLPYDREVLIEFQGQTYTTIRDNGDPYGVRRQYAGGSFHTLDAAKVAIAAKYIPPLEAIFEAKPAQSAVLDVFMGA